MKTTILILSWVAVFAISTDSRVSADLREVDDVTTNIKDGPCKCDSSSCSCCKTASAGGVTKTVCIKINYQKSATSFDISVSVDGTPMFQGKVPASNPPPECTTIPIRGYKVKACINFKNVKVESGGLSGCMTLQASAMGRSKTVDFGCFKIGGQTQKYEEFGGFLLKMIRQKEYNSFVMFFGSLKMGKQNDQKPK